MTKARTLTPRRAAQETLDLLRRRADKTKAASYQRYFKEPVNFFGVDTKAAREIKNGLLERVRDSWSVENAVNFCEAMVKDRHLEAKGTGFQVLAEFVAEAPPGLLADIQNWLEHSCGNWALVDNLAPSVLAPLLERHPELIPKVISWTESPSLWLRRGSTVAFVPLVRKAKDQERYLAAAYLVASRLFDDQEDLIHKAIGWLLREAGKADAKRLERFLLENGAKMPRTTVRYAIERFPKDERKRILEATRARR